MIACLKPHKWQTCNSLISDESFWLSPKCAQITPKTALQSHDVFFTLLARAFEAVSANHSLKAVCSSFYFSLTLLNFRYSLLISSNTFRYIYLPQSIHKPIYQVGYPSWFISIHQLVCLYSLVYSLSLSLPLSLSLYIYIYAHSHTHIHKSSHFLKIEYRRYITYEHCSDDGLM